MNGQDPKDFDAFKGDIEAAERRVASEIDPGARALVVAILVFVVLVSFLLPHTGSSRGIDVLIASDTAAADGLSLPSRVFVWLALVFSIVFSVLALLTRRWTLAWIALAGTTVACPAGMLAVWSRQT
ncbi:MAG: rane protein, partial [Mycobacterium sp.]|nr:rane protein [Mycobacterium sp.]